MGSLGQGGAVSAVLASGALLAFLAAASARWSRKAGVSGLLLAAACVLGLVELVPRGARSGDWPFNSLTVAIPACGVAAGLWSLALCPEDCRGRARTGLLVGLALGIPLVVPRPVWPTVRICTPWLALGEVCYVVAIGALLVGAVHGSVLGPGSTRPLTRRAMALGLLFQTTGLAVHGAAAQLAWGAYWSWDPVECWRLAGWLVTAIAAVGLWELDWSGWRATMALWAVTLVALAILAGSGPLVRWLGLRSLYWM